MVEQGVLKRIDVDDLELDLENPRHGKLKTPDEAITHLIEKERVIELAIDIAKKGGTNPMDLMGVFKRKGSGSAYVSAEGNRRVCALMLLHDPERVPAGVANRAKRVRALETAAASAALPKGINCIVFSSKKAAMPWIELMHIADQDGRARKRWNPDQQANAIGGGRNADAMQILDLAERLGGIERSERDAKLTTVQRYLGNPAMRTALGIERQADKSLAIRVAKEEFAKVFEAFLDDVKNGVLSSRSNQSAVESYAASLMGRVPCDRTPTTPLPLKSFSPPLQERDVKEEKEDEPPVPAPLPRPQSRSTLGRNPTLDNALFALRSQKLNSLYLSCVELPLSRHTPLISVGLWSILETLAALHRGGGDEKKFVQYFDANMLHHNLRITDKDQRKAMVKALEKISDGGNSTKHHAQAALFSSAQLTNDYDVLVPFLIAVCSTMPK